MGQTVDGRLVRDLTYNTRFGWLKRRRQSNNHGLPRVSRPRLRARRHPPRCRPRQRSVRNASQRRKAIAHKGKHRKGSAGRAAAERREASGGTTVVRMVGVKVDARAAAIEATTGVAIARASMGRLKSTSKS
jgi:hypothetical protein